LCGADALDEALQHIAMPIELGALNVVQTSSHNAHVPPAICDGSTTPWRDAVPSIA
jgi:hypothetical protein